jgi:hypothetical protein
MMAKLMWICGILLIAAGVALGIVLLVSAARPGGIDIHTAAILLVGGILSLGLGSVIEGLHARPTVRSLIPEPVIPASTAAIPEFDPRSAKPAAAAVVAAAVIVEEEVSRPTRDTIQALEQARQKIEKAFEDRTEQPQSAEAPGAEPEEAEPAPKDVAAAEVEDETITEDMSEEEVIDDGQLYVVEERVIRRHPARILSDGTVEAETAEGWMRFENLEHLDEYLDAMEQARS